MKLLSYNEIRALDEDAIACLGVERLMESAGRAIAEAYARHIGKDKVCVVAGKGNNGADGVCAARYLQNWGYDVKIFLVFQEAKGELKKQLSLAEFEFADDIAGNVIDGLFGYGFKGETQGGLSEIIEKINAAETVLSIDLPSGISADGERSRCFVKDTLTLSLAWPKEGNRFSHKLYVADIGIPRQIYKKHGIMPEETFKKIGTIEIK